jgi:hypothetical protein
MKPSLRGSICPLKNNYYQMKKYLTILPFMLLWIAVKAQDKNFVVLGKVIDSASGQPLAGASVYCQNTTYGTISNNEGLFFMRLPNGGYDLVVTYTSYDKKIFRLSNNISYSDTLTVALKPEEKIMGEVAVVATNEVADGWAKYGKFFEENFIGTTPNSASCVLVNPEALHFFYSKKRNRLKVTAHEDLKVMNYALGYMIRYQLDSFSYEYGSQISQFTGSPFFIELDSVEAVKAQWAKNRARTYLGSRLHFMRSLYDSTVEEEGYIIEKLKGDSADTAKPSFITDIYNENDYSVDSGDVVISWAGQYRISYRSVLPDSKFLQEFKLPLNTRFQISVVDLAEGFIIEENGYFYEQYDVVNTGYWAWKKIAELLPYDYLYE